MSVNLLLYPSVIDKRELGISIEHLQMHHISCSEEHYIERSSQWFTPQITVTKGKHFFESLMQQNE